jgi:hypothetical protein
MVGQDRRSAGAIFDNDDAHPPSVVCLRKQKNQRVRLAASRDDPAATLACLGTVTGDAGKRGRPAPYTLYAYGTSTPLGSQRPPAKIDPQARWQQGGHLTALGVSSPGNFRLGSNPAAYHTTNASPDRRRLAMGEMTQDAF